MTIKHHLDGFSKNNAQKTKVNSSKLIFDSMKKCQNFIKFNFGFFMVHFSDECYIAVFGKNNAEKLEKIAQANFNEMMRNAYNERKYS